MSGFVFRFCVLCPSDDGNNPGYTDYFPAGQYDSINLTGWSVNYGDEITPQINWGSAGFNEGWHAAGQDCFFDPGSSFFGVYNLTGSLVNPTFTYVGRSADPN